MPIISNTFPESTSRTQTRTLTIPNVKSVTRVTVNTGNVTFSVNGNTITFNLSNGSVSRTVQTGGSYIPSDSKTVTETRTGTAYEYVRWNGSSWATSHETGLPATSISYSSGGYTGTLQRTSYNLNGDWTEYSLPSNPTVGQTAISLSAPWIATYSGIVTRPESDTRTYTYYYQYTVTVEYVNNIQPSLTLTSPTDNQTLSEGAAFIIQGIVQDADSGNVVTVKYKINSGTARAVVSSVSDGSSPISFTRTLTYGNKRLWDGATDIAGADLAEGVDHTLTVWAEDDQGGKSAEITRKFRVIHNRPPAISGQDGDIGTINTPPSLTYTVTDPEGSTFTVTEKINDTVIRTFTGQPGVENTMTIPHDLWLPLEPGVPQTLKIEATDSAGIKSVRTYMFTRAEDRIVFDGLDFANLPPDLLDKFTTDVPARRILLTPDWTIPPGAVVLVEACNNAFDAQPTWEDVTFHARNNRGYLFLNQQKTADKWGVNFRFTIEKGTATDPIIVKGIGGAFD